MKLIINGEQKEFEGNLTLGEVLRELELFDKVMAAAVNMEIVKQKEWDSHRMNNDDKLELLDFVGGG